MEIEKRPSLKREIFVPKNREGEYLKKHNIELRTLSNGVRLFGVPRQVEDAAEAEVVFSFPRGSYHDPKGKEGIHHLMEHLIMNPIGESPEKMNTHVNAHTGPLEITVEASGVANPNVSEYGLWPLLVPITNAIKYPLSEIRDLDKVLEKEIEVVLGEKGEYEDNKYAQKNLFFRHSLFDHSSPQLVEGLGNDKSLRSITTRDLIDLANQVFVPGGMVASFMTTGEIRTCAYLADTLEKALENFPRAINVDQPRDVPRDKILNPDFLPGRVFVNPDIQGKRASAIMAWAFPAEPFGVESLALNRLFPLINHKIFNYFRQNGMGYSADASFESSDGVITAVLELDLPNSPQLLRQLQESIYPGIKKNVFENINSSELYKINEEEKLIQRAVPMPIHARFGLMREGLEAYGRIIDADEIMKSYLDINSANLADWRDKFISQDPVYIIT